LLLHDYFIARSIARLRPGGIALFVTSTGTMDKTSTSAREHIAGMADLIGAVRLPEGSMRASAGTEVVIDLLVFQRRADGEAPAGADWIDLAPVEHAMTDAADDADDCDSASSAIQVNGYFAEHPEMVLGVHALKRGIYGPALAYTCRPREDGPALETLLIEALDRLPTGIVTASTESPADIGDEAANKLNKLIDNVHRIWSETADQTYLRPDGTPYPNPGAGQMIFSDLGTIAVETTRGFSAYRWIKRQLVLRGVPAEQIAFMQDFKKSADKQRLFADFRAGRVRVLIGSSETMGTGVNVQQRLKALHHLDVPWLPSQIEQREGRIERQGNQHPEIEIFAYATLGSMDATMWQNNERKARFIEAALSGDRTIRRLEEEGGQANQFAMAKAIASGDSRLMRKAGLESEIVRLRRQHAAHVDDQHAIRRQIRDATHDRAHAEARIVAITADLARRRSTRGDAFTMEVEGRTIAQRKVAGGSLLTKVRLAARERAARTWTVGRIGGFDLTCAIQSSSRDGRPEPSLTLERTNFAQPIDIDTETTPVGIIARLEHAIDRMDAELEEHRRRVAEAKTRLAGYAPQLGERFPLQGELEDKLGQLAEIESDLAQTERMTDETNPVKPETAA
jgi:hypothetical protein